ncbi:TCR/Tet family MFS transporter [Flavisolibacter ginsengisoli]|jgi:DHA1 family tetracycline resistance protein-like MFS transporter|uniref:MFS transporter, DHA1 family, tetracycline resistance protein n=1 Tax=Flavisolibacter ginsengisoli DSM 18119 TaxID=1121884 RepID=A0A1M5DWL5_9BACT|nr:TCR/Tet family MFS transporter [Flavisolibacter ginsengisoli]SHF71320.1 MFS transporter, DHA1 family, tetracycline resistance protein [Flavisolibacter ginsengisoli DSM 18119]
MKPPRKAAMSFIFITLLIDVTGLGLIIPVLPKLIEQLTGGTISQASQWGGWLTFAYAIMQFVCAPIIGNLSDKYGRRPVLLFSLMGFGIDYLFLAFAPTIWWLFLGRIIAGITGASFTTASAYIADVSTPENRAQNFGLLGAAFGLGFIIGPSMGGLLAHYGIRVPFFVAAGFSLLNAAYGYFVLPESLSKENRRGFDWKRANPLGSLLHLKKYPSVIGLIWSMVLVYIAAHALQSTWTFINLERFNWSEQMLGLSLGVVGIMTMIVQGGLIRYINPKLGNEKSVYIGLAIYSIGMLAFAFADKSWMMFVFMVPYCLGGIAGPALQAILAGHVPPTEQGELQGALTSMISATSIVGPLVMTNLFAYFTKPGAPVHFSGAPFLLGSILLMGSAIVAYSVLRKEKVVAVS